MFIFLSALLGSDLTKVTLQLHWKHQFEFAGFYAALENGYYKANGLDVTIKEYQFGMNVVDEVINGNAAFGISYPNILLEKSAGKDILILGPLYQSSPNVLVSLKKSNIKSLNDFKGKSIMINKDAAMSASFVSMLRSAEVSLSDMTRVDHTFNIHDLIEEKVDIMSVFRSNELFQLDQMGIEYTIWDPKDYGFDFYDDFCFLSSKFFEQNKSAVLKFQEASKKGWIYAFEHMEQTVDLILQKYNTQNKSKEALLYEALTLKNLAFDTNGQMGNIDPHKIQRIYDIYNLMGLAKKNIDLNTLIVNTSQLTLNKREQDFLSQHKVIKMCNNPNWKPIEFVENNQAQGISIDTMKLIEQKLGIDIVRVPTKSWGESQQFLKEKKCDILPSAIQTQKRKKYANFTNTYLSYKLAVITTTDKPFINNLEDIINKNYSIARKKDSGLIQLLQSQYPNVNIVKTESYLESLQKVSQNEAYCTIAVLPVMSYYVNEFALNNLQVAGYTNMQYDLRIAVRDDMPILVDILNKTLHTISQKEQKDIYDRWVSIKIQETLYSKYVALGLLLFFLLALILLVRQYFLKKSLNEFNEWINATMEGIIVFKNGVCIDVNKSALEIFGYESKKQFLGKQVLDFIAPNSRNVIEKNFKTTDANPYEVELLKSDGSVFTALVRGKDLKSNGLRLSSVIDITTLKHQEKLLVQQTKMASMGEMIGNIAHQWRQPLNTISLTASAIQIEQKLGVVNDQKLFDYTNDIIAKTKYLSETIDTFKNFIKNDKKLMKISLEDEIKKGLQIVASSLHSSHIELIEEINLKDPICIFASSGEFSQVIINILNNAKDVLLHRRIINPWVKISVQEQPNSMVQVIIEDNGKGIDEDVLPKIFDPYFTTKHQSQGTGLGLHMSYKIVQESLEGKIYAKNSTNGALFVIELPIRNSPKL